ncbi:non-specific serine/threonine protein kinase [Geodermatophilus pulveris]|uniref:Non-specific serine/threonine protein kinase n=1 Tax=Geodermatophilus pulveris TaxID=1564159 RepID=A0A239H6A9_9ACTN|nr:LuxR C-terminal-related transcriptional regulator [Geodermatophilus pulveris]SNS76558.1 non-specific serine/threonine protein kinase [Geodermatophilus pulveris]
MVRRAAPVAGLRLPAERSSFVGRRAELGRVRTLLVESRLVTLVGPGGVGKTRLALRAARELGRSFPDGTALAELTAVADPALTAAHVAAAFDVRDTTGRWLPAALAEVLGERRVLLVLDNCEHLRDACAVLVDALLPGCPGLSVLATSRAPLDLPGEALCPVPPLPVGAGSDGAALLAQRARAAAPDLVLTAADDGTLAELCRRLDGIPLAIELAAVRLRTLTPAELLDRLDDRFGLLRRSGPGGPVRHRTLRATMEWSADLLGGPERLLWARAAVFAGDFDLPAAAAVCAGDGLPADDLLDVLDGLVDASLVTVVRDGARSRFAMLETVRAFGRELLNAAGEAPAVRRRHRDWCARLMADAAAQFLGPGQVAAFDRLAAVHPEIAGALEHCRRTPGEEATGLCIAADAWLYWAARGHLGEGRRRLDLLLAAVPASCPERARGLVVAGYLALVATDPRTAVPLLEEGLRNARALDLPAVAALATQYLGQAALFGGDLPAADRLLRAAAAAHEAVGAPAGAFCWADVGVVALLAGDLGTADAAFGTSLAAAADPWTRSHALWGRGLVRLAGGAPGAAGRLERQALRLMREVDDRSGVALCVSALGWTAAAHGDARTAARLAGAAESVWRSVPARLPAPLAAVQEQWEGVARRALGEQQWRTWHAEGSSLQRAAAVALALDEQPPARPRESPSPGPLTRRQQEVAGLVAQGLTDREIAARLVISPRTAESHVEQILTRLGFRSRAQIAAWAAVHD